MASLEVWKELIPYFSHFIIEEIFTNYTEILPASKHEGNTRLVFLIL